MRGKPKEGRTPPENVLVCCYWGEQTLPCVERQCCMCDTAVAVTANNIATVGEMNMSPICIGCTIAIASDTEGGLLLGGGVVGGQVLPMEQAFPAAIAEWHEHEEEDNGEVN